MATATEQSTFTIRHFCAGPELVIFDGETPVALVTADAAPGLPVGPDLGLVDMRAVKAFWATDEGQAAMRRYAESQATASESDSPLDAWLNARRAVIGASESPTILGYGYGGDSAWTVWARKRGILTEKVDNEMLEYGREIQPVTLRMFERRTGIKVRDLGEFTLQRHPEIPWMGCTLDGLAELPEGPAVVEAKNVGHYSAKEWDADEPPLRVSIQIQHQIAVTGAVAGFAVATVGGNRLKWRRVERNDRFIAAMTERLAEFWELVLTGTPPDVDASEGCREVLSLLHPDDSGETVTLPPESQIWDAELCEAEAKLDELKEYIDERKNRLRMAIGGATFGVLPDGSRYSLKTQTVREHVRRESTFRVLRRCKK